jgi:hypothetical protein
MLLHCLLYCKIPILIKKSLFIKQNAFWMSHSVLPTGNVLFAAYSLSFINLCEAFSVEEFLQKPQCSLYIVLVLLICWHSLSYITSSRKLENGIFIVISVYNWTQIPVYIYKEGLISVYFNWNSWIPDASHL